MSMSEVGSHKTGLTLGPRRGPAQRVEIYRHDLPVRLFHWINAGCFFILLASGLEIFNLYPRLHWAAAGFSEFVATNPGTPSPRDLPAVFEIGWVSDGKKPQASWVSIGSHRIPTGRVFGWTKDEPPFGDHVVAFPAWATLGLGFLGARGLHLLLNVLYFLNLAIYGVYGIVSGRFRRTLLPARDQIHLTAIVRDLWMHVRLKHSVGQEATRYNLLQKLSYLVVLFVLMPTSILSGLTMSPSAVAAFPWLLNLFDGRQSARTVHFFCAILLLLFVLVHVFQVVVTGFVNEMRSMITGHFRIPPEQPR
jgi:thiosulfate reductase cytochrome b subunit